jgi:hypothetical protein
LLSLFIQGGGPQCCAPGTVIKQPTTQACFAPAHHVTFHMNRVTHMMYDVIRKVYPEVFWITPVEFS